MGDDVTATCTCSGSFNRFPSSCSTNWTAKYTIPITVTKPNLTDPPLTIAFTASYNCSEQGTCDYSVPYNCNFDSNTCTNSEWTNCNKGADRTCAITVKDLTLNSYSTSGSIQLQNNLETTTHACQQIKKKHMIHNKKIHALFTKTVGGNDARKTNSCNKNVLKRPQV